MRTVYLAGLVFSILLIHSTTASGQSWNWADHLSTFGTGGDAATQTTAIIVDPNENVFITGDYGDSLLIGGAKLKVIPVGTDMFVARLNSTGQFAWAKSFGSQYSLDKVLDICNDPDGNVYVCGAFAGTLVLDTVQLTSVSISSVALAKYNAAGDALWARYVWNVLDGPGGLVSDTGFVYVAVAHTLAKYTFDGDTVWSRTMPDNGSVPIEFNDVALDSSGNLYVTGLFTGIARFGNDTLHAASISDQDIVVAKFDNDGNVIWAKQAGAVSSPIQVDEGHSIAVSNSGGIYVVGEYKGKAFFEADSVVSGNASTAAFIAKYDGDGHLQWVKGGNGPNLSSSNAHNVRVLDNDDILVEVNYGTRVTLADTLFTLTGATDVLMLRLTPNGTRVGAKRSDSPIAGTYGYAMALNAARTMAYVGGKFLTGATFGPSVMTGPNEGWVGKMTVGTPTDVADHGGALLPRTSVLSQNYPNPFNPSTTISYEVSQPARVDVDVFNVLGEKIRTLVNADESAGKYSVRWDGKNDLGQSVSNGVYFYQLHAGEVSETKKMILLK